MNLDFQDPFGTAKPKSIEKVIDDLYCRCLAISLNGRFLAAGCSDNSVIIFDLSVCSRVFEISNSENPSMIQSICFNRRGDRIAIVFENGEIAIKDTLTGEEVFRAYDESKIIFAKYEIKHKSGNLLIFARQSGRIEYHLDGNLYHYCDVMTRGQLVAADMSKDFLFAVDSHSVLNVIDIESKKVISIFTEADLGISESSGITSLTCHPEKNILTIICKNRCIRVLTFDPINRKIAMRFKLMDAVNKWSWRLSGFSQHETLDSLLIFGTAMSKGKHLIYLWDNVTGTLVQTLEGPKEETSIAIWHPRKPQLITVGALSGHIFIWGPDFPQKWAALVPNIEAIETNIEYIEREDEFDLPVEEEIRLNKELDEMTEIYFRDFISCSNAADQDSDDRSLYYPIDTY